MITSQKAYADSFYRESLVCRLEGKRFAGLYNLGLASVFYPPKVFIRLRRVLMH
jgi:hypothetical protein